MFFKIEIVILALSFYQLEDLQVDVQRDITYCKNNFFKNFQLIYISLF